MLGTPAFSTAATIFSPSLVVRASGFSQSTILPAFAAAMAISMCRSFGTQMSIGVDVVARDQLAPVGLDRLVAPALGEVLRLGLVAAAGRLEHRPVLGRSKKFADLAPGVGMRPAHEAVADHADVERFLRHRRSPDLISAYSRQPCASRTLTMAPRTSFQVFCFSITAFGNMQPSQQMWRIFLVRLPLSSRSQ